MFWNRAFWKHACETYAWKFDAQLCDLLSSLMRIDPHVCVRHALHYADTLFPGNCAQQDARMSCGSRVRTRMQQSCVAYASQYAVTHVGTQADQMRRTESSNILNLIIIIHVTYLVVFSQSEISDFIQKILEYINHLRICLIYS